MPSNVTKTGGCQLHLLVDEPECKPTDYELVGDSEGAWMMQ